MSQIRVGIVGAAGMIAHRYAGVLARFEDVEVRSIADPVLGGLRSWPPMSAWPPTGAIWTCSTPKTWTPCTAALLLS
jgi:hypothetical protein